MKLLAGIILLNCLLNQTAAQSVSLPLLEKKEAIADVRFLESLFFEAHLDLGLVTDTTMLRYRFDTLAMGLPDSIAASQLYTRLAPVFGSIRDIHCALMLPNESNDYYQSGGYYLPIQVFFGNDSLILMSDKGDSLPAGALIDSINGTDAEEIMAVLQSISASEGDNCWSRKRIASILFPSVFPLFFHVDSVNQLVLTDSSGTNSYMVRGVIRRDLPIDSYFAQNPLTDSEDPFLFGYNSDSTIAYMRIATFMGGNPGEYRRFLNTTFKYLKDHEPRSLILDLRNNGGGYADYGKLLLRHLVKGPFVYIDHIVSKSSRLVQKEILRESSFQPEITRFMSRTIGNKPMRTVWSEPNMKKDTIAEKPVKASPDRKHYDDLLVVMFNGLSASTTGMVLNILKDRPNTVFFGEPAGCAISGTFGQPTVFELPHSGIRGQISILRFNQSKEDNSLAPIIPDVMIPFHFDHNDTTAVFADRELQIVMKYIRSKIQRP